MFPRPFHNGAPARTPWSPCQGGFLDICTVILCFTKNEVPQSLPKWDFRFLEVPLQAPSGVLTRALWAGFIAR